MPTSRKQLRIYLSETLYNRLRAIAYQQVMPVSRLVEELLWQQVQDKPEEFNLRVMELTPTLQELPTKTSVVEDIRELIDDTANALVEDIIIAKG